MNANPYYVIKRPMLTEEATIHMETQNQYVFRVDPRANKREIRGAVEEMFPEVRVLRVNTMNYRGKLSGRRGRGRPGRRPNWKKAIVTLRPGDHIDLI